MKILTVKCLKDNYSYIVFNEKSLFAVVIDPSESEPIINEIKRNNLKLKYIFNTHHHYDHVGGNLKLKEKYRCKVVGYEKDKDRIPEIDIGLKDNQKWKNNYLSVKYYMYQDIQLDTYVFYRKINVIHRRHFIFIRLWKNI